MRFYTWCNQRNHPKLDVLIKSAENYHIHIEVLGMGVIWKRNYQKIELLYNAIKDLNSSEIILCTDAFDVLYLSTEQEIKEKLDDMVGIEADINKVVFSGEKLYSHHYPKYKKYWDNLSKSTGDQYGYKYLNSGSFIGYQKDIIKMLLWIMDNSINYKESSDQKLFGKYEVKNPGSIILDRTCKLFWCAGGEQKVLKSLYRIDQSTDQTTDQTANQTDRLLRSINTESYPTVIHIPASKLFYNQILKIAYQMNFISHTERLKYIRLHQKTKSR